MKRIMNNVQWEGGKSPHSPQWAFKLKQCRNVDRTWLCWLQERTAQEVLFEAAKHILSKLFHLANAVEMEAPDVQ
jgi:hypothetical protein